MINGVGLYAANVTPSDAHGLAACSHIYCGEDGNIAVVTEEGSEVTFTGLKAGTMLPVSVQKVKATGTTSTIIVAVW